MKEKTARPIGEVIKDLKVSPEGRPITQHSLVKKTWCENWLQLNVAHHPDLQKLERAVTKFCLNIWVNPKRGWLLVIHGENGTGKTHCAKAVHRWIQSTGHANQYIRAIKQADEHRTYLRSYFWSWPELIDHLKNGGWDIISDLLEVPVLIIDELGGEHDPSRVGVDKLCQVLSHRERMFTLVTTNIQPEAWEKTFDRRIASRFGRNAITVDLSNVPDFATL